MITVTFLQAWHSLFKILSLQEQWKAQNCFTLLKTALRSEITQNCDLFHPPSWDRRDFHTDAVKQHSWIIILCISQLVLVISPSATSAPRLSLTLFLFLKFLLLIKSLKTLVQYRNFLVLSYSLVNWLILRVILTLSSHWASTDAKGFFQIFLHFIFVPTEYKYRTQFCNSGLKMQISLLLGNLFL